MNTGELWILVAQFALPFFVLSILLIVVLIRGRKHYKEAARQLIVQVKSNEKKQKEQLMSFLTETLLIEKADAKNSAKKILNERKFLFRNLISGLLDKNTEALVGIDNDLSRLSGHYHKLPVSLSPEKVTEDEADEGVEPKPAEVIPEDKPEAKPDEDSQRTIKKLKKEVKELKHEVHITLTTLNNIFGEFSSMFGEEVKDREMSVDQIINAMQTFSNKLAAETSVKPTSDDTSTTEQLDEKPVENEEAETTPVEPETVADTTSEAESVTEAEVQTTIDEPVLDDSDDEAIHTEQFLQDPLHSSSTVDGLIEESLDESSLAGLDEGLIPADEMIATSEEDKQVEELADEDPLDNLDEVLEASEDISTDEDLDDIDSVLDELELDDYPDDEPSWDDAFEESGDKKD